ncbi:hypothetical protein HYT23_02885 [Candidatus Pacearchaeota archaeon]|nr:hypothetical protein [Candidatus Pacearchaeota archaeon]
MTVKIRYDNDENFNFYLTVEENDRGADYITVISYDKLSEFLEKEIYNTRAEVDLKPERGLAKRFKNLGLYKNSSLKLKRNNYC